MVHARRDPSGFRTACAQNFVKLLSPNTAASLSSVNETSMRRPVYRAIPVSCHALPPAPPLPSSRRTNRSGAIGSFSAISCSALKAGGSPVGKAEIIVEMNHQTMLDIVGTEFQHVDRCGVGVAVHMHQQRDAGSGICRFPARPLNSREPSLGPILHCAEPSAACRRDRRFSPEPCRSIAPATLQNCRIRQNPVREIFWPGD